MEKTVECFIKLVGQRLPKCRAAVDAPNREGGNWWIDVNMGQKRYTLEFRPGQGFGFFHGDVGYGQGPAEICPTPELAVQRLTQLMAADNGKADSLRPAKPHLA